MQFKLIEYFCNSRVIKINISFLKKSANWSYYNILNDINFKQTFFQEDSKLCADYLELLKKIPCCKDVIEWWFVFLKFRE